MTLFSKEYPINTLRAADIMTINIELTKKPGAPSGNNQYVKEESGNTDNISNSKPRNEQHGTSLDYTLRRLRKEAPTLPIMMGRE